MTDDADKSPEEKPHEALEFSSQPLHLAFQGQVAEIIAKADLTDEQRQLILIAMSCPCCGAGGLSLSFDLKDDGTPPKF